jgi:stage IV sporulation protein FB
VLSRLTIDRLLGVKIRLHPLFVLFLFLSVLTGYYLETLTLFAIVIIHEFGHIAAAKSFGWRIRHIRLLPFGGVAEVEEHGNVPAREELIVALSGPLQHVWMILLAEGMKAAGFSDSGWWDYFIGANLTICFFNLLPILPLDGGKVLQILLGYGMSYRRSLLLSTYAGLVFGGAIVLVAAWRIWVGDLQLNLLIVGLFLCASNWYLLRALPYQFLRFLMSREAASVRFIGEGSLAQPIVVARHRRLGDIVKLLMRDRYHLVYVLGERGIIQAVLPEQRVVERYLRELPPGSAVSDLFVLK